MSERRAGYGARAAIDAACSEADLQRGVVGLARLLGYRVYHTHDSRRSPAGFPDLVLVHPSGRLIFAEMKRQSGSLTVDQRDWLHLLGNVPGVLAVVWRPSDWSSGVIEAVLQRTSVATDAGAATGGTPARERTT